MPSKSKKQARLMAAVAHNPKFAKKVGISQSVGREFNAADKKTGILRKAKGGKVKTVRELKEALDNWQANKLPQEGFFSTLDELILTAPFDEMPAYQWSQYLQPGRKLYRDGIEFPLKQEELHYAKIPELAALGDQRMSRQDVQNWARHNRPAFDQVIGTSVEDDWYGDVSGGVRLRRGLPEAAVVQEPKYMSEGLYHQGPGFLDYEESSTISPDIGDFEGDHFSSKAISHSRTSRHRFPDVRIPTEHPGTFEIQEGPTARLVEEIQSDRHSRAGERVVVSPSGQVFPGESWIEGWKPAGRRGYRTPEDDAALADINNERTKVLDEHGRLSDALKDHESTYYSGDAMLKDRIAYDMGRMDLHRRAMYEKYKKLSERLDKLRSREADLKIAPPDAPFKNPADHAALELKKQLLNSVADDDRFLALTRGEDQIARYEQGMQDQESRGMREMYDKVYPGELKKLARKYGAPVQQVDIPVRVPSADYRLNALAANDFETWNDVADNVPDWNPEDAYDWISEAHHEITSAVGQHPGVRNHPDYARADRAVRESLQALEEAIANGNDRATDSARADALIALRHMDQWREDVREPATRVSEMTKSFPGIEITPDVRERVRRVGVPIWQLGGVGLGLEQLINHAVESDDQSPGFYKGGNVDPKQRLAKIQARHYDAGGKVGRLAKIARAGSGQVESRYDPAEHVRLQKVAKRLQQLRGIDPKHRDALQSAFLSAQDAAAEPHAPGSGKRFSAASREFLDLANQVPGADTVLPDLAAHDIFVAPVNPLKASEGFTVIHKDSGDPIIGTNRVLSEQEAQALMPDIEEWIKMTPEQKAEYNTRKIGPDKRFCTGGSVQRFGNGGAARIRQVAENRKAVKKNIVPVAPITQVRTPTQVPAPMPPLGGPSAPVPVPRGPASGAGILGQPNRVGTPANIEWWLTYGMGPEQQFFANNTVA